jgi:hypothetical protein
MVLRGSDRCISGCIHGSCPFFGGLVGFLVDRLLVRQLLFAFVRHSRSVHVMESATQSGMFLMNASM